MKHISEFLFALTMAGACHGAIVLTATCTSENGQQTNTTTIETGEASAYCSSTWATSGFVEMEGRIIVSEGSFTLLSGVGRITGEDSIWAGGSVDISGSLQLHTAGTVRPGLLSIDGSATFPFDVAGFSVADKVPFNLGTEFAFQLSSLSMAIANPPMGWIATYASGNAAWYATELDGTPVPIILGAMPAFSPIPTTDNPEPGTWMMLGAGLVACVAMRRRCSYNEQKKK